MIDADIRRLQHTDEARAVRERRDQLARQPGDLLADRVRLLRYWRERDPYLHPAARATPRFPHVRPIYRNPVFWKYLLPRLRARLQAQLRERERQYHAELRAQSERRACEKALAKAGPMPLFNTEDA